MADLIKKVKIMQKNGTFTDYIPLGADAANVKTKDGMSVENKLKKKPYYFDTVADMKVADYLKEGDMAITLGYYEINDNGGAEYKIVSSTENYKENLNNRLYAELIIKKEVNVKQFGAKGDDQTNDTQFFINAISSVSDGGVVYVPNGHYLIDQITIPKNVTLKAKHETIPYNITNWYNPSAQQIDEISCLLRKNTNAENMIICYGFMENICVDGNNKSGNAILMLGGFYYLVVTRAEKAVRLYTDGYGDGVHISNGNNYDLEHLYLMGNLGDALTVTGADMRLQHFNIASNKGNGLTFTETAGTLYFNEGKIEWNGKNNIYSNIYAREIVFNNCILDAANWYNFYDQSGGEFTFENCMIKGGRRDSTYNNSVEITSNSILSQIYITQSSIFLTFNNCFFRKDNQGATTEQIEYIIGSDTVLNNLSYLNFTACNMPSFNISHILYNIPNYNYYFVGCNYSEVPIIGSPAKGLMPVLPFTDASSSTINKYQLNGAMGYDYSNNFAVLNVFGNMRKIPTFSDYSVPIIPFKTISGTAVLNEVVMPTEKGTFLISCSLGGSQDTNYYYIGIFSKIYGAGLLTDISKSNVVNASVIDGKLQISCTTTIYDGKLSIIKI